MRNVLAVLALGAALAACSHDEKPQPAQSGVIYQQAPPPAVVQVQPAPPPTVYYAPPPVVYGPPAYYGPPVGIYGCIGCGYRYHGRRW